MKLKTFFLLSVIFAILFSSSTHAANDKTLHFGISSIAGYLAETAIHNDVINSDAKRIAYGTLLGSIPGLVKEVIDSKESNNHFSGDDMVANFAGAFTGSLIANRVNNRLMINFNKKNNGYFIVMVYRD